MAKRPAIKAPLIDLSGTVIHDDDASLPIARRLRATSAPFRFRSDHEPGVDGPPCAAGWRRTGIDTRDDEVWTSLGAVNALLRAKGGGGGGGGRGACPPRGSACAISVKSPALPYDSVVVAFAPARFDYGALNAAFRVLMDRPFVATHRARYPGDSDGALSLGPGPFVAALEHATGRTAEIMGEIERKFFEMVLSTLGSDARDQEGVVAVIGDDVQSDLGDGAIELGFWRVLVRTGKYRNGDETRKGIRPPDEICDSFSSFVESLLDK
ncbi:HAD-like domain-containing protein [Russula earlei]|uniref:HAD-like domain-containing protein n=1 Tax=Russula earlei TaxID=71964 RepID=A0ACC0U090_9AGAM|nr:HAD-like domain-containing protein [Russula earlei]